MSLCILCLFIVRLFNFFFCWVLRVPLPIIWLYILKVRWTMRTWQNSPIKRIHKLLLLLLCKCPFTKGTKGHLDFPGGSVVKNQPADTGTAVDTGLILRSGRCLVERMATHSVFLPGKSDGQRSLAGYSPWGRKESDMTEDTVKHFPFILPSLSPLTSEYIYCIDIFLINLVKKKALYTNYVLTMEFSHTFMCFSV